MNTTKSAADEHAERPHAPRSSSQLGNLVICPGFRPKPTKKIHWVTAQGNRGHAALDSGDDSDLESTYEERMVRTAQRYSEDLPPASREFQEMKVDTLLGRWGYTDRLRIRAKPLTGPHKPVEDSNEADLLDWKFVWAKVVVDAEINLQGKDYVLGIFDDPNFAFLDTIHVHFVMPRFQSVTTATYTRADIPRLQLEVFSVLMAAKDTDRCNYTGDTLKPHISNCVNCGAAGNCVALRAIVDTVGRGYDPDGYGKTPPIPQETHASKVNDPVQRAQLLDLARLAEEFAKSVRQTFLLSALEDEKNLPAGYEIDWAKGKRYVTDSEAVQQAAREFGLTDNDLLECSTIGWTRLEELLRRRAPKRAKSKAVEDFGNKLVELGAVERPEPTPKLRRIRSTE